MTNCAIQAISYIPEVYHDVFRGGKFFRAIDDMHAQYGPIVRINPDEVHLDDPEILDVIFPGAGRRTNKPPVVGKRTGTPNSLVATVDHDFHRRRRNAVNAFFSTASIRRLEPIMKEQTGKLLARMGEHGRWEQVVQMHHMFKACTSDVINMYAFGESFSFLDRLDYGAPYFEAVDVFFGLTHVFGHFTWLADLIQMVPVSVVAAFAPSLKELGEKQNDKDDHFRGNLPKEDKTDQRLAAEAQLIIFAGEGTTAYTLSSAVYELLSHPEELQKLRAELIRAIPNADEVPSFSQVDGLPYFNAIVQEVIRLHPGVMNRQPRISPDLPIAYHDRKTGKDYTLPPGTLTTMSPLTTHMNPEVFVDPYEFRPQRWIDNPTIARSFLGFSRGSRSCLGMNLARKEMAIVLASLFRKYDIYRGQEGPTLELYDTERARDIDPYSDKVIPVSAPGSKGLRVRIRN
ncbi:hypothetical protein PG991_002917 [Apiospora marii]|uniref:Cytochrome P450 n=1 Tax=Apiospora marii TaxID=335849 RepID=A0ABR1SGW4_9PEZI